jgi:hypothetical protein
MIQLQKQSDLFVSHHRHSPLIALNEEDTREANFLSGSLHSKIIHLQSLTLANECWQHTTVVEFEVGVVAGSVAF